MTRPTLVEDVLPGLPALRFATHQLTGSLKTKLTAATVFALCRYTSEDSDESDYLYVVGTRGRSGSQMSLARRPRRRAYHFDGELLFDPEGTSIPANDFQVLTQVYGDRKPESHRLYQDGGLILATTAEGEYGTDGRFVIGNFTGGINHFPGDLVEFIVYDRALEDCERALVEDYLRQRGQLEPFGNPGPFSNWHALQYDFDVQPNATWIQDCLGGLLHQSNNADASIFLSDIEVAGAEISGTLSCGVAADAMGFVFAFENLRHYYLFEWRGLRVDHCSAVGQPGMRLRVVDFPDEAALPCRHFFDSADFPDEYIRTLESQPTNWEMDKVYDFTLRFDPGELEIVIDEGETNLASWTIEDATYSGGKFGYYINSLQDVTFGPVTVNQKAPRPEDFARGDANIDESIDISDSVFILNWLFVGGEEPMCLDAADVNDSGGTTPDISDPVYLLNWLFVGGPAPPAPGPEGCGTDPTLDCITCIAGNCP